VPDSPVVSVIVPCYNRAEMLKAAARSVVEPRLPVEILVADDGSTEDVADAVAGLARDPGYRLNRVDWWWSYLPALPRRGLSFAYHRAKALLSRT
jgi:alpha-1,6-rhamnosyltransferase